MPTVAAGSGPRRPRRRLTGSATARDDPTGRTACHQTLALRKRGETRVSDDMHDGLDGFVDGLSEARMPRKSFLVDSAKLAAAAAAAGPFFLGAEQAKAAEAASLGGDPIATKAINAAKAKYSNVTLSRIAEVGPQALEPKNFSGPLWKKLVGGNISVVEAPFADIRTKAITEHLGKSGALEVIDVSPAWVQEFDGRGVILTLEDLI